MTDHSSPLASAIAIAKRDGIMGLASRTSVVLQRRLLSRLQRHPTTWRLYSRLFDSTDYWEQRYVSGGSSGPGSEGAHAEFKAEFVNRFIDEHDVESVLEFGCGDGSQVALGEYPSYVGLDVSESVIKRCRDRFSDDTTKRFHAYDPFEFDPHGPSRADLVLSLEVVFHLVDDEVYEKTMHDMFTTAKRYVIVFSSNEDERASEIHVRHRRFTEYVEETFPEYELVEYVENPFEDRVSDFYVYERTAGWTGQR